MKVAIRQVRGNSGTDVWGTNLCKEMQLEGHECMVELFPQVYQILPALIHLHSVTEDCDIIQGNSWNAFAFKAEVPLVVTEHLVVHDPAYNVYRTLPQKLYHRWIYRCERRSLDVADAVVCVSENTRESLEAAFGYSDSHVIHNGVDTTLFRPEEVDRKTWKLPDNKTILFFAGNLSPRKGADLLPAIMDRLGNEFILLTTSGNRDQSRNNIPYSLDLGHLNLQQLINAYNLCDIFILPSRLEGLSLSTLEAMACAKPVVAFNCSSFPELIIDGRGGFLSEIDDVKSVVERIRYLAKEPELIQRMGMFNREKVLDKFTIEMMTGKYIRLYQSLLE